MDSALYQKSSQGRDVKVEEGCCDGFMLCYASPTKVKPS